MACYPATDSLNFLNLAPFHNIGQPAKTAMLCLFAVHATSDRRTNVAELESKATSHLKDIITAPRGEQTLTARFNAAAILVKKPFWPLIFDRLIKKLDENEALAGQSALKIAPEIKTPAKTTAAAPTPTSKVA